MGYALKAAVVVVLVGVGVGAYAQSVFDPLAECRVQRLALSKEIIDLSNEVTALKQHITEISKKAE